MMKQKKYILALGMIVFRVMSNLAQPGTVDPTFNTADQGFWKGNSLNSSVTASFVQADGKTVVAGMFTLLNETKVNRIIRFNEDGTLDASFSNMGTGSGNQVGKIIQQPDGKLLITGQFQRYNNIQRNGIARLNTDGSLDTTFNPGGGIAFNLYEIPMVLQNDGKIIIGGYFTKYDGKDVNHIVRINTNGTLDTTFHIGTGTDGFVYDIVLQNDGKAIIAGNFTRYNGEYKPYLLRINPDGSFDPSFNQNGNGPESSVNDMAQQSDGKIILTGGFRNYNGVPRNLIGRINADGSLDNSFAVPSGIFSGNFGFIKIQTDGKLLVIENMLGVSPDVETHIVRLNSDGTPDTGFNTVTKTNGTIQGLTIQKDGKIIIGGYFTKCSGELRNYIARLNSDGTLDNTLFALSGKGVNGVLWTSGIQSDGKIIVGGKFSSYNGTERRNIARLNIDGTADTSFHPGSGPNDWVECVTIQTDGKILLAGWFTTFDSLPYRGLVRLNKNGSLDTTLHVTFSNTSLLETVSQQADGKIIVGGNFNTCNGITVNNIARLFPNGMMDTTFKASKDMDASATVWRTVNQANGKIIVTGYFNYAGTTAKHIVRLNTDGTLDPTFNPGISTDNIIFTAALQADGKMVIIGDFTTFNGKTANGVCRLNTDGSLDSTFSSGTGPGYEPLASAIQENGKIIIAGSFETYNGMPAKHICRLNKDGSLDNTFQSGSATDRPIYTTSIQPDGKIILGGNFTNYDGTGRNGIVRIIGDATTGIEENKMNNHLLVYPNPNTGQFTILLDESKEIAIYDLMGKQVFKQKLNQGLQTINLSEENNGLYLIRALNATEQNTEKIVIKK